MSDLHEDDLVRSPSAENDRLQAHAKSVMSEYDKVVGVNLELTAEIERLQQQCEGLAQSAMNNGQDLLLKEAEIERLSAIKTAARAACDYHKLGYKLDSDYDVNHELDLMNALSDALDALCGALEEEPTASP